MNRLERDFSADGEAKLKYSSGDYKVIVPGSFVICAVTGDRIALEDLRYWNAERQEAYSSPEASLRRERGEE